MEPEKTSIEYRKPLHWGELDPHRRENTYVGMWAWMWQRISALAIVVLLALHLTLTYKPWLQFLLLLAVTFHAALGVARDPAGLQPRRSQVPARVDLGADRPGPGRHRARFWTSVY